jgi:diguanylate cyclase (GGDEF)-like protein/PAS domain S-box-containing protein
MTACILVVDDNATNLRLASELLEMEGYTVLRAEDAERAQALLAHGRPDLILMDIALPGTDGLALTGRIKRMERLAGVPIVAVSAFAMKGDREKALAAGCDGYITKPIDTRTFPAEIATYLRQRVASMRLLIVDDREVNLRLLRAQLEAEGQTVLEAANGVEALEVLRREQVDGVISDILMPLMDGYRLCLEVRQDARFASLPFVLYTSTYNSPSDRELAKSAGADAYISKPAPVRALLDALAAAARAPRALAAAVGPAVDSPPVLRQYSETLIRKLEEKSLQLEAAQQGLVQVGQRMSGLVETAMDAIIAIDEDHRIVLFNSAASRMFGRKADEVLGETMDRLLPERFRRVHHGMVESFTQRSKDARSMGARPVWALRADGTEFPIEASISSLDTSQGRLSTVFIRDISERHAAQQAIAQSESSLRRAEQMAQLAHLVSDADGSLLSWSNTLPGLLGSQDGSVPASLADWLERVHPDDSSALRAYFERALASGEPSEIEYRLRRGDDWVNIRQALEPMANREGKPRKIFHVLQDVSRQKQSELRIERLNRVYAVLSGINNLIVRVRGRAQLLADCCRLIVETGGFLSAWIGMVAADGSLEVAASHGARAHAPIDPEEQSSAPLQRVLTQGLPFVANSVEEDAELVNGARLSARGTRALAIFPLMTGGKVAGLLSLHSAHRAVFDTEETNLLAELAGDISFALDHLVQSEHLERIANFDPLTGLPNRRMFAERLNARIAELPGDRGRLAIALLDLERFRRVNETLGRAAGDELLRTVATRLSRANPDVARVGVDLFALAFQDLDSASAIAAALVQVSARAFDEPFTLLDRQVRVGWRAGVAVYPVDGRDAESLLRNAEAAWRRARSSSERCVFYVPEMNSRASESMDLETQLRNAIERREFVLYYQPKVNFSDHRICGVEALIRWQHPDRGLVPPMQFIPVLEETGLIGVVGRWAIEQALLDHRRWLAAGHPAVRVAVNVSPLQFQRPDFATHVADSLADQPGSALELELTEGVVMENISQNILLLKSLRELGVSVAIDDFGTGYSSLAYLAKLPITSLKIDRAFVTGMVEGPEGLAMVSSIIALAHALRLKVVAEGVETEEQARLLRLLACDEAQGYFYSRPVPAESLAAMLAAKLPLPIPASPGL